MAKELMAALTDDDEKATWKYMALLEPVILTAVADGEERAAAHTLLLAALAGLSGSGFDLDADAGLDLYNRVLEAIPGCRVPRAAS